ncbi:bifunctional enoyl-CoA hydratase/phosphate acetyltransferase [Edaphobacter paludis]|uniref:Bifunctional enoyl-CoA hydratase/phosphate acetyltransferase n=1 Tax=Edaphobacter paludis TaxID=3035702 RepID=A0AAU7DBQ7_9BACT
MSDASLSESSQVLQNEDLFESLIRACQRQKAIPVAVCWPCSSVSLAGAVEAARSGLILPVLVGNEREIREIADREGLNIETYPIMEANTEEDAAIQSVELCRSGRSASLMKGSLHTDVLMHAVLKEQGLRTSRRISHIFIMEAPLYHRQVLFITDSALNISPSLEDKVDIVQNAIDLAHALGVSEPRVAILSAVETVCSKMMSTVDAAALCKMADRGQITGAILDGPLAFDTAVSAEAALRKDLKSPVAGEADILVAPDLEAGNMLAKELEYLGGARSAGIVMGAKVPIILTSRADSVNSRVASCAVASVLVHRPAKGQNA